MCGIVGYIDRNAQVSESLIGAMTNRLQHRGPDGFGSHLFENIGIGHRRLSFIDLQGGHQPLCNEDGTVWITYNGELYNFKELRTFLLSRGHVFKTSSDTEVIVHAYEEWGTQCLSKFRGMFAFVILDQAKRRVFVARDHIGIKPFYYAITDKFTAFSSEIQAFKAIPHFNLSLDLSAIDKYLWFQYIPAPQTAFNEIKKLKPGHYAIFDFDGKELKLERYWKFSYHPDHSRSEASFLEELEVEIKESVKKHLISDVPFGAFLSGGIDSTAVVTYMTQVLRQRVKTFSIGFEEQEFNELDYASEVARKLGTDHHVEIVKPDALGVLPKIVQHYGEPFGDSSAIPTYYVCQMARKEVKMVLSGDGGDEAFAGYKTYTDFFKYEYVEGRAPWKDKIYDVLSRVKPDRYPARHSLEKWFHYIQYMPLDWRVRLWKPDYQHAVNKECKQFNAFYAETQSWTAVNRLQFLDLKTYLPYDILTKVDVASMIHSLEVRTPLTDVRIWEVASKIPEHMNLRTYNGKMEGKLLLKRILEKNYSKDFIYRKKMGFSIPITKWFKEGNETGNQIREMLIASDSQIGNYFSIEGIEYVINSNNYGAVWLLLFLEYWLKDFRES